ncbi:MAG: 3-oxocholest-4-en-26-oate---CoA ligase [Actinomycetota bacterium]|nr:3-oxocholest-4-en-26-oate---CoA ligase [Actinomycetota bacterium]
MERNLADIFEVVVDAVPEREALVCGDRRLTYAALDERANRLAHHLAGAGVGPGDHVAAYLYNGTEFVETMLAAFKLRAAVVNVNYRYVPAELAYLLADSDAKAVVYDTRFTPTLAEVEAGAGRGSQANPPELSARLAVGTGDAVAGSVPYEDALDAAPPVRPEIRRTGDDLYLLYTGGTTGMPKGVMWRHTDILAAGLGNLDGAVTREEEAERARTGSDRHLPACPLMHGAAQWVTLATFYGGGAVILSPDTRLDAGRLAQLIATERATVVTIIGDAVGRPLADALAARPDLDVTAVRVVMNSGATVSPPVKDELMARMPGAFVYDTFGSSESGTVGKSASGVGNTPTQGRFAPRDDTIVLDDDLRPVAPGSGLVGRLARSGAVALGYYNDPEKTAATFPVIDGVRYIVTGDHALVEADGTVQILGRGSACINTGGEKVYPDEVEGALKSHPEVADAMVVGVPDERFGERVVALVVLRHRGTPPNSPGAGEIPADLEEHVRARVAGYKAPRQLFPVEAVERFPSGKPDYGWARDRALDLAGRPGDAASRASTSSHSPA